MTGKVFIMSVRRGVPWPEERHMIVQDLGGTDRVVMLNVTSQNVKYRKSFSPMHLPAPAGEEFICFENWYQSGKVLRGIDRAKRLQWWKDQKKGKRKFPKEDYSQNPVEYTQWEKFGDRRFTYVESRKLAYVPEYWRLIANNKQFLELKKQREEAGLNIIVIDCDGPYSADTGKPEIREVTLELLKEKIEDERHPFGHGYIVAGGLLGIDYGSFCD